MDRIQDTALKQAYVSLKGLIILSKIISWLETCLHQEVLIEVKYT